MQYNTFFAAPDMREEAIQYFDALVKSLEAGEDAWSREFTKGEAFLIGSLLSTMYVLKKICPDEEITTTRLTSLFTRANSIATSLYREDQQDGI